MLAALKRIYSGYNNQLKMPLGGYAVLMAGYVVALRHGVRSLERRGRLRGFRPSVGELLLLAVANQKLALLLTREWVTSPLRAPFTKFQRVAHGGELDEISRGSGIQAAIGDLLCCPYCAGVWMATGMLYSYCAWPERTRLVASILVIVNLTDHLHGLSERLEQSEVFAKAA